MNTKKTLIAAAIVALLFLSGCVATPYYGSTGYYRSAVYGYGNQPSVYYGYSTPRYYGGGYRHAISGHIHLNSGHKHIIGGHKHFGGGHHGRGHRGHHR